MEFKKSWNHRNMGLKEYSREQNLLIHLSVFSQKRMYENHLRMIALCYTLFQKLKKGLPTHAPLHSILPSLSPSPPAFLIIHPRASKPPVDRKFFLSSLQHSWTFLKLLLEKNSYPFFSTINCLSCTLRFID